MRGVATRSPAALAAAAFVAGCLARTGGRSDPAQRRPLPPRSVSVTIYSAPPWEKDEDPYYDYRNEDWRLREERRKKEQRRVATQMRLFAKIREYDTDTVPYGIGIIKDERDVTLPAGRSEYRFAEVARYIEPETVRFMCLTSPGGANVLEQNFEYDIVSADAMLDKYIGRDITVVTGEEGARAPSGTRGRLLSADEDEGDLVIETAPEELEILRLGDVERILFSKLPGGLITRPTLAWLVDSARGGHQRVSVAYRTRGLVWEAGYTAVLSPDEKTLALSGVATIANASGATYENARLKLVAGEVNLVEPMEPLEEAGAGLCLVGPTSMDEAPEPGFKEKRFFEYHLYTLGRRCTIKDMEVKQIELFAPAARVPVRKSYVYYGSSMPPDWESWHPYRVRGIGVRSNGKVDVYLHFRNEEDAGLGIPLPAGPVRVMKRDPADGEAELVGGGLIDHTPRDEETTLRLGSAFDLVGEWRRIDFRTDVDEPMASSWVEETVEITLRNHKDQDVRVTVKETMYRWSNWEITKSSCEYQSSRPRAPGRRDDLAEWEQVLLKAAPSDEISFEFKDTPLHEAVSYMSKWARAAIVLDPGMEEHRREELATLKVRDVFLPRALEKLVSDLRCTTKGGKVFITDKRKERVRTRSYDPSGMGIQVHSVCEAISCHVEPGEWGEPYGTSVKVEGGLLVVAQTPEVHHKIARYLRNLGGGLDHRTVTFPVTVPASGERKITYTVRYTW